MNFNSFINEVKKDDRLQIELESALKAAEREGDFLHKAKKITGLNSKQLFKIDFFQMVENDMKEGLSLKDAIKKYTQ